MNILVISDYDQLALDLKNSLGNIGHKVSLLTTRTIDDPDVINISPFSSPKLIWLKNAIRSYIFRNFFLKVNPRYAYFQDINENQDYYPIKKIKQKIRVKPNIIIILFDYRIVTTRTIRELFEWSGAKIVWMIPDMKPMTGGCSYAGSCLQYTKDCANCPAVKRSLFKNFPRKTLQKKIANLSEVELEIVTGSTYQQDQAKRSSLFHNRKIYNIPFPSAESFFYPNDKTDARNLLNIPTARKIVLFGASSLKEERKGFQYIIQALRYLKDNYKLDDLFLLIVGKNEDEVIDALPYETRHLGYVDFTTLALAYQSADIFLCPTIDDSGPVMVSQAMMCGTPVIAFRMGISIDIIKHSKTGYICNLYDYKGFADCIVQYFSLSCQEKSAMAQNCVEIGSSLGFKNFLNTFNHILNGK